MKGTVTSARSCRLQLPPATIRSGQCNFPPEREADTPQTSSVGIARRPSGYTFEQSSPRQSVMSAAPSSPASYWTRTLEERPAFNGVQRGSRLPTLPQDRLRPARSTA